MVPDLKRARGFAEHAGGVSAVEFALIAPLLLILLLGSFEITRAMSVKGKVTSLADTIADFVSREEDPVTEGRLAAIILASTSVMYPFPAGESLMRVEIQSIGKIDDENVIDWSYDTGSSPPQDDEDRGTDIDISSESEIRTTVTYTYALTFPGILSGLNLSSFRLQSTVSKTPRGGAPIAPDF